MCYEFSNWSWKLRAAELARKEHEAANAAKKQDQLIGPSQPAAPETRVDPQKNISRGSENLCEDSHHYGWRITGKSMLLKKPGSRAARI